MLGLAPIVLMLPLAKEPLAGARQVPELPRFRHGQPIEQEGPVVVVDERRASLDGTRVARIDREGLVVESELAPALARKRALWRSLRPNEAPPSAVYLRVNADLPYGTVVRLMRDVHAAGYAEVSFIGVSLPP